MISLDRLKAPPAVGTTVWVEGRVVEVSDDDGLIFVEVGGGITLTIPADHSVCAEVAQMVPDLSVHSS